MSVKCVRSQRQLTIRIIALVLLTVMILSMIVSCAPVAHATGTSYDRSGIVSIPKLSKEEIAKALKDTSFQTPDSPWSTAPVFNAYHAGILSKNVGQRGVDRLNALRAIAGLTPVTYSEDMAAGAQKAALLMATSGVIVDTPQRPANMSEELYKELLSPAQSCVYATTQNLCDAVDHWMLGIDSEDLGTRRQQLNPTMPWVGYGYVKNPTTSWWIYKDFWAASMTSGSSAKPNYKFISWPASGYFPTELFSLDALWSVSLNSAEYQQPDYKEVQVTLTRESDGATWILHDGNGMCKVSGNTVMFKPSTIVKYSGIYTVKVSGIRLSHGVETSLSYQVEFFDAKDFDKVEDPMKPVVVTPPAVPDTLPPRNPNTDPTLPTTGSTRPTPKVTLRVVNIEPAAFEDVTTTYWAHEYISQAYAYGVMVGSSDYKFLPSDSVTGYELAAVLLRLLYREEYDKLSDTNPWTTKVDQVASTCGLWVGLSGMQKGQAINRNQMAAMIANALRGSKLPAVKNADSTLPYPRFSDWEDIPKGYRDDVATCTSNGILNGIGDNKFGGNQNMSRAQVAAIFCRIADLAEKI